MSRASQWGYVRVKFGLQDLFVERKREVKNVGNLSWYKTADFRSYGWLRSCWSCHPSGVVPGGCPETTFGSASARAPEAGPEVAAGMDAVGALVGVDAM